MSARRWHLTWIAASIIAALAMPAAWIPLSALSAARGEWQFQHRLAEYCATRRLIADELSTAGGSDVMPQFALELRAARSAARPGDIVRRDVAERIRAAVEHYLAVHRVDRSAILSEVPRAALSVNNSYPAEAPLATMPPLLLRELPALPPELQYRFAGNNIVLLDIDANLVVDVVPDVLGGNR
jgi:hypothetical protein